MALGSIVLDKHVVSAKYLLTYNAGGQKVFKIDVNEGIKVVTRKELSSPPYEYCHPHHDNNMLFHLTDAEKEFQDLSFEIKDLNEEAYKAKKIFAINLTKLFSAKRIGNGEGKGKNEG